jgi:hypothetical protein
LLLWPTALLAQQPAGTSNEGLKLVVVQGEDARNNIRMRTGGEVAVKVLDETEKPVAGAEVVFQVPGSGPSGRFYDWLQTQTVKTNAEGVARARGLTPNEQTGQWHMRVLAQHGVKSGQVMVAQNNVIGEGATANGGKSRKKLWIAVGVVAVAAIVAAVVAGGGDDAATTADRRPVIVATGTISVGGPR